MRPPQPHLRNVGDRLAALGAHARESLYPRFSAARRACTLTSLYDELHGEVEQERSS